MKITRILNLITFLIVVTINALANALPINGLNTGEISDQFNALFTPAGYVFSIWGVIYLALGAFAVYQILPQQNNNQRVKQIGPWFIISNVFNSLWILAWHYQQFILSFFIMIGILVSLLVLYIRLGVGIRKSPPVERWLVETPFSIYLGWISVATIANASVVLITLNWGQFGLSAAVWTAVMISIAGLLGILMSFLRREIAYSLVLIWAIIGITQNGSGVQLVNIVSWIVVGLLVVGLVLSRLMKKTA
ncbi:MAG: tryptophan-rich sensory protein [Anaerolineaceae bacterium]|nr:tryptophan-rich sensory protein [Anaerolineaceae bacterium]